MAVRYEIEPVKQNVWNKKVNSVFSWIIIAVFAATILLIAKYILDSATKEILHTYGPISASPISESYFDYEINTDNGEEYVVITGYHGDLKEVNIPDKIDGIKVREIARFAFMSDDLIYIVRIPEGVTMIGNMCFFDCPSLRRVYIPESASSIGGWCFGKTDKIVVEGINGSKAQSYCEERNISFEGYSYQKNK